MTRPDNASDAYSKLSPNGLASFIPSSELDTPQGNPFSQAVEGSMSISDIYADEMYSAVNKAHLGGVDVLLAAKGVIAGAILGVLQSEMAKKATKESYSPAESPLLWAASQPVDWKAVATAGAVFGVTSGVRRATRPYTVGADIEKTAKAARASDEFIPHTERTYKRFKRLRAVRDLGFTAAATGVAYEAGTQLTVAQNLMLGVGLTIVSATRMGVAKMRYNSRGF